MLANEIRLLLGNKPAETEILRRGAAVELRAGDVAFLDAQDAHGLETIGDDVVGRAGGEQRLPDRAAAIGGRVDLVGKLTREADAEDAHGRARDMPLAH